MIQNPILPGFNPDPSIVRVGEDYYIATSTFEWFPGVQIHHSRDLANWQLVARPLDRISQLNMIGNPNSGGIWAPCLSHCDGTFYLIYTDVKQWADSRYKITHNYLTTAPTIEGPWSEPIYLDSSGFDASLFHDDDGRKWYLSMIWDHRVGKNQFAGTLLQEFDETTGKLVGPRKNIFRGTELKLTEGPHLYKKDGWYYLLVAEGGTWWEHAVTMARSKTIDGPYEVDPENPFLTSRYNLDAPLQKAGHASLVETQFGTWYAVHLCSRPRKERRCMLGRETAIQKFEWSDDGWPRLVQGGRVPATEVDNSEFEGISSPAMDRSTRRIEFDTTQLDPHFQSLRRPVDSSWLDLEARPGWLRLYGEEPTTSNFRQSLIARRIQSFTTRATTCLDFQPDSFKQMAGLVAYYDTKNHYYLRVSMDEGLGRHIGIIRSDSGQDGEIPECETSLPNEGSVYLRAEIKTDDLQFSYSLDGESWQEIGPVLDASILSDDYFTLGFTGAFVGLCAQDLTGRRAPADFDFFHYEEI
ncbi:glycoside hydrolase family 43 protein [Pelagicoccus sp. SDUM812003]|uniref:glycoside hydrolase family 43 protein n=1 Tax=Pelagicoccus sp. SDUM812003 TaxID=3041267 RepID=UPI00280EA240|nr:glycoside hydrolase family 43 protein [Pelagicoccus sp. SDUM812003]MDQ8203248.1 glycoside hydrolase family 43 protein [Pelagicoccus sp. SDUM812003]